MATEQEILQKEKIAETKRELQRRSLDQIAVFNPLEQPFQTVYDGYAHVAQPKSEAVFPRYVAVKWMREYVDHMINEDEKNFVDKENEKRASQGHQPLTAEERNDLVSAHGLLTSNEELRMKYMKQVYKGISKEHGLDVPVAPEKKSDRRPMDEKLLTQLDKEMGTEFPEPDMEAVEVEEKKEELLKELDE